MISQESIADELAEKAIELLNRVAGGEGPVHFPFGRTVVIEKGGGVGGEDVTDPSSFDVKMPDGGIVRVKRSDINRRLWAQDIEIAWEDLRGTAVGTLERKR